MDQLPPAPAFLQLGTSALNVAQRLLSPLLLVFQPLVGFFKLPVRVLPIMESAFFENLAEFSIFLRRIPDSLGAVGRGIRRPDGSLLHFFVVSWNSLVAPLLNVASDNSLFCLNELGIENFILRVRIQLI